MLRLLADSEAASVGAPTPVSSWRRCCSAGPCWTASSTWSRCSRRSRGAAVPAARAPTRRPPAETDLQAGARGRRARYRPTDPAAGATSRRPVRRRSGSSPRSWPRRARGAGSWARRWPTHSRPSSPLAHGALAESNPLFAERLQAQPRLVEEVLRGDRAAPPASGHRRRSGGAPPPSRASSPTRASRPSGCGRFGQGSDPRHGRRCVRFGDRGLACPRLSSPFTLRGHGRITR